MAATYAEPDEAVLQTAPTARLRSATELMSLLLDQGIPVVPYVASRLFAELDGDARSGMLVASVLSPEQRRGTRCLPNPLPLTDDVAAAFRGLHLAGWEREVLLAASVCVDDATETLLSFAGCEMSELIESDLSRLLSFVAGHFSFVDPRTRIWSHESADLAARTTTHARLHRVYRSTGDERRALWHLSLSSMAGERALAPPLLALARTVLSEGDASWAFDVAREAVGHAGADEIREARITAGMIALGNGYLDDAQEILDHPASGGSPTASGALLVVTTLRSGIVPAVDRTRVAPSACEPEEWRRWGTLTAVLAMLSSERGAEQEGRHWEGLTAEADEACGAGRGLGRAAVAWRELFTGGTVRAADVDPVFRHLLSALELGLAGRTDEGIRMLAADDCAEGGEPVARGYLCSPLSRAYRGVTEALLRLWAGDLHAAGEVVERTALQTPLSLPFAGLAVVIARRIELAEHGRCGALSASLAWALPPALHQDQLVERGVEAYLTGRTDEAATHIALWADRRLPGPELGLPGLDEVGPIEPRSFIEPADSSRARHVRAAIRSARTNAWARDYQAAADASRSISSSFERARVEALLGTTCITRGDRAAALRHLRAAQSLFADAGAGAWERAVGVRLARLGDQITALPTAPTPICAPDPLASCRAAWEPLLTDRELQVAMLVADGRTNREIATSLHIALRTVEVHVGRLFAKFGVKSRAELTVLAHRTNHYS